jgi:hypothetical protein
VIAQPYHPRVAGNYLLRVKAIVDSFVAFGALDGMGPTAFAAGH